MFERVTIRVADLGASERFYDTVLAPLGIRRGSSELSIEQHDGDHPVTRDVHFGFRAPSRAAVDEFWRAGTQAGYEDDGAPGPRPQYTDDYYGSFLLDPDGNSVEAVHHGAMRGDGGSFTLLVGRPTENLHMTFRGTVTGVRVDPEGNRVEIVS